MNKQQFLDELSKHGKGKFCLTYGIMIRSSQPMRRKADGCCPITFLAYCLTGDTFSKKRYIDAAHAIGLDSELICPIVSSSDSREAHWRLRSELLEAVGLTDRLLEKVAYKPGERVEENGNLFDF